MDQRYLYEPSQSSSYFNPGTGRFHNTVAGKQIAPEWDGNPDNIPPGFGVIRVEMGREPHETDAVSVFVNGYSVLIPRGSARVVSAIHINRLTECIATEYTQTQFYRKPDAYQRPRFPMTLLVPPKDEGGTLIDANTGSSAQGEAKRRQVTRNRSKQQNHSLTVDDPNESDSSSDS